MKLTVNIDCTPEEARAFFGLPDVTGVNKVITDSLEKRTQENIESLTDPHKYMERMMEVSGSNMEAMRAAFTSMMAGMAPKSNGK